MIKWLEKKLIERILKDVIKELPKLKISAKLLLEEKKDYIIEQAKEAIKEKFLEILKKH